MTPPSYPSPRQFLEALRMASWRDGRSIDPALAAAWLRVPCCGPLIAWAQLRGLVVRTADGRPRLTDAGVAATAAA